MHKRSSNNHRVVPSCTKTFGAVKIPFPVYYPVGICRWVRLGRGTRHYIYMLSTAQTNRLARSPLEIPLWGLVFKYSRLVFISRVAGPEAEEVEGNAYKLLILLLAVQMVSKSPDRFSVDFCFFFFYRPNVNEECFGFRLTSDFLFIFFWIFCLLTTSLLGVSVRILISQF